MRTILISFLFTIVSKFSISQTKVDSSILLLKPNEEYLLISLNIHDLVLDKKNKSKRVLNHFEYFCFSLSEPLYYTMYSKKYPGVWSRSTRSRKAYFNDVYFKNDTLTFVLQDANKGNTLCVNVFNKYDEVSLKITETFKNGRTKTYLSDFCQLRRKVVEKKQETN
jgi:hypothetical protein